jgi:hypothetical protein
LDFLAYCNLPDIPYGHIEADTILRNVNKIHLNVRAIACGHQHFSFLLFSLNQTPIKAGLGYLAAFMTTDGPSSHFLRDG